MGSVSRPRGSGRSDLTSKDRTRTPRSKAWHAAGPGRRPRSRHVCSRGLGHPGRGRGRGRACAVRTRAGCRRASRRTPGRGQVRPRVGLGTGRPSPPWGTHGDGGRRSVGAHAPRLGAQAGLGGPQLPGGLVRGPATRTRRGTVPRAAWWPADGVWFPRWPPGQTSAVRVTHESHCRTVFQHGACWAGVPGCRGHVLQTGLPQQPASASVCRSDGVTGSVPGPPAAAGWPSPRAVLSLWRRHPFTLMWRFVSAS